MKLPSPWNDLALKLGGVEPLAKAFGTVPRTVNDWVHGQRIPRGPAWLLIQKVFREHGLKPPERAALPRRLPEMGPGRLLSEVEAGVSAFFGLVASGEAHGFRLEDKLRGADGLARAEAALIALKRAAYAASLALVDARDTTEVEWSQRACRTLCESLAACSLVGREGHGGNASLAPALQSLQVHRMEALDVLREALAASRHCGLPEDPDPSGPRT